MRTVRERRLHAIAGLDNAVECVRELACDDRAGFGWIQLVSQMREAVAVLRSANEDNER